VYTPGYAFVDYEKERDADDAIYYLAGKVIMGNALRLERGKGASRGGGPRGGGGGSRRCVLNLSNPVHNAHSIRKGGVWGRKMRAWGKEVGSVGLERFQHNFGIGGLSLISAYLFLFLSLHI
jgi:RNA recognition motif-containing protein